MYSMSSDGSGMVPDTRNQPEKSVECNLSKDFFFFIFSSIFEDFFNFLSAFGMIHFQKIIKYGKTILEKKLHSSPPSLIISGSKKIFTLNMIILALITREFFSHCHERGVFKETNYFTQINE